MFEPEHREKDDDVDVDHRNDGSAGLIVGCRFKLVVRAAFSGKIASDGNGDINPGQDLRDIEYEFVNGMYRLVPVINRQIYRLWVLSSGVELTLSLTVQRK